MTTTTGRRHSRRVTNSATAECNTSGCMEILLCGSHLQFRRLDGPINTRDFKILTTRSLPVLNLETEEAMYLQRLLTILSAPNVRIRKKLTGCSILHERDIAIDLVELNMARQSPRRSVR
ncbi:hypothetical protein TNCV_2476291 [Trichonephila clavipes]|nr:hypothetical protein TNCV_2476291 [Trichonephila clavipes]